ncbi:COPI associated [Neoconidiobolus thromboides FSU 785]|nr:COPI associated [Neoconidiobolus thromboides FSU 785]
MSRITDITLRILNIIIGVILIIIGIQRFFFISFSNVILAIYSIVFGIVILLLELHKPEPISSYCAFLFYPLGRGLFYIFLCALMLGPEWFQLLGGLLTLGLGIVYVILQFAAPSVKMPAPMMNKSSGVTSAV